MEIFYFDFNDYSKYNELTRTFRNRLIKFFPDAKITKLGDDYVKEHAEDNDFIKICIKNKMPSYLVDYLRFLYMADKEDILYLDIDVFLDSEFNPKEFLETLRKESEKTGIVFPSNNGDFIYKKYKNSEKLNLLLNIYKGHFTRVNEIQVNTYFSKKAGIKFFDYKFKGFTHLILGFMSYCSANKKLYCTSDIEKLNNSDLYTDKDSFILFFTDYNNDLQQLDYTQIKRGFNIIRNNYLKKYLMKNFKIIEF